MKNSYVEQFEELVRSKDAESEPPTVPTPAQQQQRPPEAPPRDPVLLRVMGTPLPPQRTLLVVVIREAVSSIPM